MQKEIWLYLYFVGTTGLLAGVKGIDNGEVRLSDGGSYYGRVEIYYNGEWGTVCDDSWDLDDAEVVCRQLGLGSAVYATGNAYYGRGVGTIILDEVACSGYEQRLDECRTGGWYTHDCVHSEDAGVECSPTVTPPDVRVRLVGSSYTYEGRVEIFKNNTWGTICDDFWGYNEALVVCRQLGFSSVSSFSPSSFFGEGFGPILGQIECSGHENSIVSCYQQDWDTTLCSHYEDASVVCENSEDYFREYSVRLTGSSSENTGRVEIYYLGTWGTVCDDDWDLNEAKVVCRQLGYPDGAYSADDSAYFGEGEGPILLDQVSCHGWEKYLVKCGHQGWFNHDCGHHEDAGVRCNIPEQYYPRLVNGTDWYEGRVEVWNVDHWERVCASTFNEEEARTVCNQLGFKDVEVIYNRPTFGDGPNAVSSVYFSCEYYDTVLSTCSQYRKESDYCEAAAITCKSDEPRVNTGAITAVIIIFVVLLIVITAVTCCVFTLWKQTVRRHARPTPGVAVIGGSTGPQQVTYRHQRNTTGTTPPRYNEVTLNFPHGNPPVSVNTLITPQPFPQGETTATSGYQISPDPKFPNISTPIVHHPLPPNANPDTNQQYRAYHPSHQRPPNNDPVYAADHISSSVDSNSIPPPRHDWHGGTTVEGTLTHTDNPSF